MKKILSVSALLLGLSPLVAQPTGPAVNDGRVKLADMAEQYQRRAENPAANIKSGTIVKEGKDYHFHRWLWYWQQHTDQQGYIVSPAKTVNEYTRYQAERARHQSKTTANLSNWQVLGPDYSSSGYNGIGRVNVVEFHPTNPNLFWVGSAGGGLWQTTSGGQAWINLTDHLPSLSVSDVDVNPIDPRSMYLCTGDRDGREHYSIGVLKSVDGGITWDTTGIKWNETELKLANCLVINKADTNSLTLAASDGLYKSFDAGKSWRMVYPGHFKQVLYHPYDTSVLFASTFYEHRGTQIPAQIYRSADGGSSWQQVTHLQYGWRIALAVTPADPSVVKAVVASTHPVRFMGLEAVLSSSDTGKNFQVIADSGPGCSRNILSGDISNLDCGGQGWYDLTIAIDPQNPNSVYVGGVNTWHSADGGVNWNIITQWADFSMNLATVHADKHWLTFHPLLPGRLYECNDGGIYYSDNPLSMTWTDISDGLVITQFYRNAVANRASFILGGSQDNGTKRMDANGWFEADGGDGMDCHIDPVDTGVYYCGVQYGIIDRIDNGNYTTISDNIPGQPEGAWITPYIITPQNHFGLVAGYDDIYYSPDRGDTWVPVTTNPLVPGKKLLRLAMTPASPNTLYAVAEQSNEVFVAHNFFPGNTPTFNSLAAPMTGNISDIEVNETDPDHFWITYSGYNSPKVLEYRAGQWSQMSGGLPNVPILCIERDTSNDIMYIGTDIGVFYMDSTSTDWQFFGNNLPAVHVTDLGIHYPLGELVAATYGRGMWSSPKQEYQTGVHVIPFAPDAVTVSPNPANDRFLVQANGSFANQQVSMRLVDYTGRTVWTGKGKFTEAGELSVATSNVPAGNYIFEIAGKTTIMARTKMVINR